MENRELFLSLFRAGKIPALAHVVNAKFSEEQYEEAKATDAFAKYCESYTLAIFEGADALIFGQLYRLAGALNDLEVDDPNYPRINKEYRETLKLTEPIVMRLAKIASDGAASSILNELELRIEPPPDAEEQGESSE